jgi:sodium transport system permease protein
MARDPSAEGRVRRGLAFGAFMLLFLYFSASLVQAASPLGGLAVTLWVLVLVPALLYPIVLRLPLRSTLGLRGPRLLDLCLAPLLAVAMTVLVSALLRLQGLFLELPEEVERQIQQLLQLESLGVLPTMLLFAVSPAICEEILWRGTFQGEIQAQGKTWSTAFVVGLFFGLFHQSIYRFLPTAFLGGVLAVLRARTGSILPCIVAHGTYNALLILRYKWVERTGSDELERIVSSPWCIAAAAGIAILVLVVALPRRPSPR